MDVVMPGMNGVEAKQIIREVESGSRVPIITFAVSAMPGNREQYLAAEMDDFLSKPFKRAELAAKLACVANKGTFRHRPRQWPSFKNAASRARKSITINDLGHVWSDHPPNSMRTCFFSFTLFFRTIPQPS